VYIPIYVNLMGICNSQQTLCVHLLSYAFFVHPFWMRERMDVSASTISHIIVTSLIRYDTNLCPMNIDHQGLNLHLYRLYLSISNDYRCIPMIIYLRKNDIDLPIDYISLCLPMIIRFYRSSRFEFTPISIYLSISNDYNHWLTTGVTGQNPPRSRCCATPDIWAPFEPRTPMWSCDLVAKPGCPQQGTWGMLGIPWGYHGDTMGY